MKNIMKYKKICKVLCLGYLKIYFDEVVKNVNMLIFG